MIPFEEWPALLAAGICFAVGIGAFVVFGVIFLDAVIDPGKSARTQVDRELHGYFVDRRRDSYERKSTTTGDTE